jgi:hypothetical protein
VKADFQWNTVIGFSEFSDSVKCVGVADKDGGYISVIITNNLFLKADIKRLT